MCLIMEFNLEKGDSLIRCSWNAVIVEKDNDYITVRRDGQDYNRIWKKGVWDIGLTKNPDMIYRINGREYIF